MRKKLSISLATAFLMISGGAYADGNITGTVFNKTTSKPLDFATVVLVNPETGAPLLIGTTTDENGVFIIPNAPSGKYIVRVSMIGNVTQEREITIGNSEINLGKNDFALFPSASIGWSFLGNNELKLNYSRRIRRPFGPQLNTFENISDPSEVHLGNPLILPEYSNAVELSYIKNWTGHMLSVSGYLRTNNDMISHVSFLAPMASDPNVNTMYYGHANVGNMVNTGVEIVSRNLLFRRLTLTTTLNLYNSHLKAWSVDYPLHNSFYVVHGDKQNRLVWDVRCMASVRLPWDMTFQATSRYNSRRITAQGTLESDWDVEAGVRKNIGSWAYRFSARIFLTQKRRTMSFTGTATRSQSANGREVAHYVWPSPIPSANPTVVSIIATTTSTPVATEKSIITKLGKV